MILPRCGVGALVVVWWCRVSRGVGVAFWYREADAVSWRFVRVGIALWSPLKSPPTPPSPHPFNPFPNSRLFIFLSFFLSRSLHWCIFAVVAAVAVGD